MTHRVVPDGIEFRATARVEDGPGEWGQLSHGRDIDPTNWREVEDSIERLDGQHFNELSLSRGPLGSLADPNRSDGEQLIVGGGEDDRVCVQHFSTTQKGIADYLAIERHRGDEIEMRTVGGQGTDMPARMWVAKQVALRAVQHFIEHGGRDPAIDWEFDFLDPGGAPVDGSQQPER
jgi:hypothetical protein